MKPSEILKKSLNGEISNVKSSRDLDKYLVDFQGKAKEAMLAYTTGVATIARNMSLKYEAIYDKFMDEFEDYITGEIKCEVAFGEAQIYFSTNVSNSVMAWDEYDSLTNELGNKIEKFYIEDMKCSAEVALESQETIIIILKIKILQNKGLPKAYVELLRSIDPTIIDDSYLKNYED